ncbi:copper homeostasis protein CutC [Lactobacillus sp. DCY120]|uniref:PF03932 family protein CutC n=1 Tax=Bombilactobacillus apium TaxID=2675299 RepID=A0A850R657_9LACO|nr:copper homeostasis protein CutC [Bombilactobacillus apium]NVY96025.1 copper homeostasis protein CutC [Bombilactobacillus apium]
MIREVCLENFTHVQAAIRAGADRIELNDNLPAGGTTPSAGVIQQTLAYTKAQKIPVVVMIRPRGGDFVYSADELAIMEADLQTAADLGVENVTFGALTREGQLDLPAMTTLIARAKKAKMKIVMHMAYDALTPSAQPQAIDWLVEQGVQRILTHGGPLTTPITKLTKSLRRTMDLAAGRIEILPGGGITSQNVAAITTNLGLQQAHGTRIIAF